VGPSRVACLLPHRPELHSSAEKLAPINWRETVCNWGVTLGPKTALRPSRVPAAWSPRYFSSCHPLFRAANPVTFSAGPRNGMFNSVRASPAHSTRPYIASRRI